MTTIALSRILIYFASNFCLRLFYIFIYIHIYTLYNLYIYVYIHIPIKNEFIICASLSKHLPKSVLKILDNFFMILRYNVVDK